MLGIRCDAEGVTGVEYLAANHPLLAPRSAIAARAAADIERYLDDPAYRFRVPLKPRGTPFQQRVWRQILDIPSGASRTYGEIAQKLVSAPRAVGQACGSNPIALIIPCHRVDRQPRRSGRLHALDRQRSVAHQALAAGARAPVLRRPALAATCRVALHERALDIRRRHEG